MLPEGYHPSMMRSLNVARREEKKIFQFLQFLLLYSHLLWYKHVQKVNITSEEGFEQWKWIKCLFILNTVSMACWAELS